jgi:hypothetical protein
MPLALDVLAAQPGQLLSCPEASEATVKAEYRKWLRHAHPDKGGASVDFVPLNSLWQALFLEMK